MELQVKIAVERFGRGVWRLYVRRRSNSLHGWRCSQWLPQKAVSATIMVALTTQAGQVQEGLASRVWKLSFQAVYQSWKVHCQLLQLVI